MDRVNRTERWVEGSATPEPAADFHPPITSLDALKAGLGPRAARQVDLLFQNRRRAVWGEYLHRVGDECSELHFLHSGSCKTVMLCFNGQQQIVGCHIGGDFLGFSGISTGVYDDDALVLEPSEIWGLPLGALADLAREIPVLHRNFFRLLSQEAARNTDAMTRLRGMSADQRVALFLLELSARNRRRGYPAESFKLPLRSWEIGSLLGLTHETVSRVLGRFRMEQVFERAGREVRLINLGALARIALQRAADDAPLTRDPARAPGTPACPGDPR